MTAAPIEWPISIGGAEPAGDVLDVGDVIVEPGDEYRLAPAARAVTAQRKRVRRPAFARRTRAGNTAPSTTRRNSRRGRTAAAACGVAARRQARADFEYRDSDGKHG